MPPQPAVGAFARQDMGPTSAPPESLPWSAKRESAELDSFASQQQFAPSGPTLAGPDDPLAPQGMAQSNAVNAVTGGTAWGMSGSRPTPGTGSESSVKVALLAAVLAAAVATIVTSAFFLGAGYGPSEARDRAVTMPRSTVAGRGLDVQSILERTEESVVAIHTGTTTSRGVFGGAGTGIVLSSDGLILTNAHVVGSLGDIRVTFSNGLEYDAELVGSIPDDDVALIQARGVSGLEPAELGSSENLQVGDEVLAIGNALNLGGKPTVTLGIVSAKDRTIHAPNITLEKLIQTDAAINPGNSGGPLINAEGQVVGVNTAIISDAQNIGFAIPIDIVKPLIEDIRNGRATVTLDSAFLGVSTTAVGDVNEAVIDQYGIRTNHGAFIQDVTPGSAAAAGGLREGDVITSIDGTEVKSSSDLGALIRSKQPGDTVTIEYERRGMRSRIEVTLKSRRDSGG
ncbi:MAG: trypsin-like peptidase domain-containing protein [Acidimicrobiales bacterium]|nr:trypsin-like peptidase domain-containing protein [Acidimicrobiales bacterium]